MGGGAVFLPLGPKEPGWLDRGLSQKDLGRGGCLLQVLPMCKHNKENSRLVESLSGKQNRRRMLNSNYQNSFINR